MTLWSNKWIKGCVEVFRYWKDTLIYFSCLLGLSMLFSGFIYHLNFNILYDYFFFHGVVSMCITLVFKGAYWIKDILHYFYHPQAKLEMSIRQFPLMEIIFLLSLYVMFMSSKSQDIVRYIHVLFKFTMAGSLMILANCLFIEKESNLIRNHERRVVFEKTKI